MPRLTLTLLALALAALLRALPADAQELPSLAPTPAAEEVAAPAATAEPTAQMLANSTATTTAEPAAQPASADRAVYLPIVTGPPEAEKYPADNRAYELEVLRLVNAERAKAGLPALVEDAALTQAARRHSIDMATTNNYSHDSSDGTTFQERARQEGYGGTPWTEAIMMDSPTPADTMYAWMHSPGHHDAVLDLNSEDIGLGFAYRNGCYAWTMDLGNRIP